MTDTRCQDCGTLHPSPIDVARCRYRLALSRGLRDVAASLPQPPEPNDVADLVAHLGDFYSDGERAHRAALRVLQLGWRKTVGGGS